MTEPPKPPEGWDTWGDYGVYCVGCMTQSRPNEDAARAELAALRDENAALRKVVECASHAIEDGRWFPRDDVKRGRAGDTTDVHDAPPAPAAG